MARPQKQGLDYFPLDVDFFADKKIKILKARYGSDGILIYLYLLCEIYKNGYYIKMDEDYEYIIQEDLNLKDNVVSQVMKFLFNRSLLKEILVNSDTYITSKAIQKRFQEAIKTRKKPFAVDTNLWILSEEETIGSVIFAPKKDNSQINPNKSEINPSKSRINSTKESKVKKSKVNKSKVNKSKVEESRVEERKENKSIVNETKENQTIGEKRKGYYFVDLYSHALELFCNICKTLPKPKELTDERKLMIDMANIKLNEYGKTLEELFKIVDDSDFLSGRNGKWTGCNLEWVLKPANITKIMEGNYANQEGNYGNSNFLQPPLGKNAGITSSYDLEEYENKVVIENWDDLVERSKRNA